MLFGGIQIIYIDLDSRRIRDIGVTVAVVEVTIDGVGLLFPVHDLICATRTLWIVHVYVFTGICNQVIACVIRVMKGCFSGVTLCK